MSSRSGSGSRGRSITPQGVARGWSGVLPPRTAPQRSCRACPEAPASGRRSALESRWGGTERTTLNDTLAPADELAALKADNARLTAENERLKSLVRVLVDDNPDGIVIADPEYKLTFNPAGKSILGAAASQHTPGEFTKNYGLRTADNKPHPPDTLPLVRAKRGEIVENALLYAVTPEAPDGVWLSTSARPLSSGGAIVVFR